MTLVVDMSALLSVVLAHENGTSARGGHAAHSGVLEEAGNHRQNAQAFGGGSS